jgi:hypothetical protein
VELKVPRGREKVRGCHEIEGMGQDPRQYDLPI